MVEVLTDHWSEFSSGFWVTVRLVVISFGIAMVVGTLVAALRIAPSKWLQRIGGVYVEVFRNIPLLVLLFISFAGLRRGGVDINAWVAGTASLGFSYAETLRRIVLPQAFRTVISPLGSLTIAMIKNSAIIGVSLLALPDLLKQARIVQARTFQTDETFFWAAVGYLILTGSVTLVIRNLERRFP